MEELRSETSRQTQNLQLQISNAATVMTTEIKEQVKDSLRGQRCPEDCNVKITEILLTQARGEEKRRKNRGSEAPEQTESKQLKTESEEHNSEEGTEDKKPPTSDTEVGKGTEEEEETICEEEENWGECIMKKVKTYFKEEFGWMPWANLSAVLLISITISSFYCRDRNQHRRIKVLEQVCKKEIRQLKKRERNEYDEEAQELKTW